MGARGDRCAGPARRLLIACLVAGAPGWALTAPGAAAGVMAEGYGIGLVWVGLLGSALAATYAALQLPSGLLVDRLGVRVATSAGLGLAVVAHAAALLAPLPWLALVARALAGAGYAVCFVSGAELARSSGQGARGTGLFGGVSLAASGVSVLVVPLVAQLVGWRSPWITGLALTVAALAMVLTLPDEPGGAARPSPGARAAQPSGGLRRDTQLPRLAAVHAATLGLGLVLSSWATSLLEDIWSFGPTAAAVVGAGVLGLSVVSRPLGGQVVAARPALTRPLWVFTLLLCAAATLALAWRSTPLVAVTAVVVLGVVGGLPFASVVQAAQQRQPARPAAAVGAMNTAAFGLVVTATPIVGWAIGRGHATEALVVVAALWVLPLLVLPRREAASGSPPSSAAAPS